MMKKIKVNKRRVTRRCPRGVISLPRKRAEVKTTLVRMTAAVRPWSATMKKATDGQ